MSRARRGYGGCVITVLVALVIFWVISGLVTAIVLIGGYGS